MVIGTDGNLSAWGINDQKQLFGDGNVLTNTNIPVKSNLPAIIKDIACSGSHTIALGFDGTLSGWGANLLYQLGLGNNTSPVTTATKINVSVKDPEYIATPSYNLSVDILSTTHSNFGKINNPVSITNNNRPNLTISNKNSAANLSSIWTGTYIPKGSILQFNLINAPVSSLLVNLTVEKQ